MIQAKLVNKYHTISFKDGKWCFKGHYSDYATALQQAKAWTKMHPDTTYDVTVCDPIQAVFAGVAPTEYVPESA